MMKRGLWRGLRLDHDAEDGSLGQNYFPERRAGTQLYNLLDAALNGILKTGRIISKVRARETGHSGGELKTPD